MDKTKIIKSLKLAQDVIYYGLLIFMVITLLSTIIARVRNPDSKRSFLGFTPTIVMSSSMLPTLQVYSINIIKDCDMSDVDVGDIIVYKDFNRHMNIIHRVYETEYEGSRKIAKTQGDNNSYPDTIFTDNNNLVGKVVLTMNWTAPIIAKTMLPDKSGFDNLALLLMIVAFVAVVWFFVSVIYWVVMWTIRKLVNKVSKHNKTKQE